MFSLSSMGEEEKEEGGGKWGKKFPLACKVAYALFPRKCASAAIHTA